MITVSIPVHNIPVTLLERAVTSVLQNDTVSRVVVSGDGHEVAKVSTDPRVTYVDFPTNKGRYHRDAAVLESCDTPLFTVHDADDWQEAGRLDFLAAQRLPVVFGPRITHLSGGRTQTRTYRTRPYPDRIEILYGMQALYRTSVVRGLIHPGYRVSWDAMLDNLICLSGWQPVYVDAPAYRIQRRAGSLTTSPETGLRTVHRRQVGREHAALWKVYAAAASGGREAVREAVRASVSDDVRAAVALDAKRVAALIRD